MASATTRVLHIMGTLDHGGAELRALEQMEHLASDGVVADFVCLSGRPGALAEIPQRWGGTVFPMKLGVAFPRRFLKLLRENHYDVIHSHVSTASGAILALARAADVPIRVAQFHSDSDGHLSTPRRRAQRALLRGALRRYATSLIGVSPESMQFGTAREVGTDERMTLLTNGVSHSRTEGRPILEHPVRLVNVGRPLETKRRSFLAPVLQAFLHTSPDAELIIVGKEGEDTQALMREATLQGYADRVSLCGIRSDVRPILADASVFVFPSSREGLSVAVLESLFEGTPVVCCDLAGARYILTRVPGIPLRTLPVEASPEDWARTINELLEVSPSRSEVRRLMESSPFTLDASLETLRRVYGVSSSLSA